jgi:hypothetical protein
MKDNESVLYCMIGLDGLDGESRQCWLIGMCFSIFLVGLIYLIYFSFKVETFENKKINIENPTIINQLFKKKFKNNIFFKY